MSRSLSAKSLKTHRSGTEEDSKALKMRVPQQPREFFAEGISSTGVETGSCLPHTLWRLPRPRRCPKRFNL